MALIPMYKKIDLPNNTQQSLPNVGNQTGESLYYNSMFNKSNRTTEGNIIFSSQTSGITYRTADRPDDVNIFNKGETGMMNLLASTYGGQNGWLYTSSDHNTIVQNIENVDASIGNLANLNTADKSSVVNAINEKANVLVRLVTLATGAWVNNQQIANIADVHQNSFIVVGAQTTSREAYSKAGIYADELISSEGRLGFKCTTVPTVNVQALVWIIGTV